MKGINNIEYQHPFNQKAIPVSISYSFSIVKENTSGEFAEQILADLIRQGYSGEELLEKFKQAQRKVRPAVEAMLAEADRIAESKSGGYSLEDVFGTEDEK